jgi:hypothetical protein
MCVFEMEEKESMVFLCAFLYIYGFVYMVNPLDFQGLSNTHWTPPLNEEALFQSSGCI